MPIRDVVNIGIGGSDLRAEDDESRRCVSMSHPALNVHHVSNLDGAQLAPLLQTLGPRTTLSSSSARPSPPGDDVQRQTARDWLRANLGDDLVIENHFAAVSSKPERAVEFGDADRVFPIWDWVGGRYSLWSAVGLAR